MNCEPSSTVHKLTLCIYVLPYTTKSGKSRRHDVQSSIWIIYATVQTFHGHPSKHQLGWRGRKPKFTTTSGYASSSIASTQCFATKQGHPAFCQITPTNVIAFRQGSIGPKTCRTKAMSGPSDALCPQHRGQNSELISTLPAWPVSGTCFRVQLFHLWYGVLVQCRRWLQKHSIYSGANALKEDCRNRPVPWTFRHSSKRHLDNSSSKHWYQKHNCAPLGPACQALMRYFHVNVWKHWRYESWAVHMTAYATSASFHGEICAHSSQNKVQVGG